MLRKSQECNECRAPTRSDNVTMLTNQRPRDYARVCIYEVRRKQGFPGKRTFVDLK